MSYPMQGKLNRFYESLKRNSDLKKLDLDAELKGGNNN